MLFFAVVIIRLSFMSKAVTFNYHMSINIETLQYKQCKHCIFCPLYSKGSTSFKLSESLTSCGLKTGLFVSPHLASFRERMQVNSELISEESFIEHLPRVLKLCAENSIPATLFELTFILACIYWEKEKCEVVVLEVRERIVCYYCTVK